MTTTARAPGLRRGSNLPHVADYNAAVLLDAIRRAAGGTSRVELAAATGLAAQTVSGITRRLLDEGLVVEQGKASSGMGKPRSLLALNAGGRFAVGVHLDPAVLTYVVLDLVGTVVARTSHPTPTLEDADAVIASIAETVDRLVDSSGVDRSRVLGLGIASPGPLDLRRGALVDPPHLPGWHDVLLRDRLAEATGLPTVLDKDVVAAAIAERWSGAAAASSTFAFVYLGTGIGAGFVVDDIVVRGSSGNAGDVGHLITDVDGEPCHCGQRGCLGIVCSPVTLTREAAALGVLPDAPEATHPLETAHRFAALCRAADEGDARAVGVLEASARRLARAIDDIANLIDADLVVIGGPAWTPAAAHYLPVIEQRVNSAFVVQAIHPVTALGTAVGEDVGAVGAACLVLDRAFSAASALLR